MVDGGPPGLGADYYVNGLFTSVRVCEPGSTSRCQTIDHVLVDTGAVGVRMLSAAAGGQLGLSLRAHTASDGNPLVQCMQFLDGFTWGPIALADIYPVSYTHLDVYKRQVRDVSDLPGKSMILTSDNAQTRRKAW